MDKGVASLPSQQTNSENGDQKTDIKLPFLKRKKLIFGLIGTVIVLLTVIGLWFGGVLHKSAANHHSLAKAGPIFVKVPEIVTNLSGSDGQDSYAKLKVTFAVGSAKAANFIRLNMPKFIDVLQTYLRSMQPSELSGASGTYRLKEALIARVRIVAAPIKVEDVLFEELIVQ